MNSSIGCSAPSSRQTDVMRQSSIPQGTIHSKGCRSLLTLIAKPWVVMPRRTWTPIEPILRSPAQTPVRLSRTPAPIPHEASDSISSRSIRSMYAATPIRGRSSDTIG